MSWLDWHGLTRAAFGCFTQRKRAVNETASLPPPSPRGEGQTSAGQEGLRPAFDFLFQSVLQFSVDLDLGWFAG